MGTGVFSARWPRRPHRPWVAFLVTCSAAAAAALGLPASAVAARSTHNVAYVFDDTLLECSAGCGMNDTTSDGGSIFTNAVTGTQPGSGDTGTYTPDGGSAVSLTNVSLTTINTNKNALDGFDTVILYQLCNIGAPNNAAARAEINSFLNAGGKVMIFDADGCAPSSNGTPDWSGFLFPFTSNNPGPHGASGSYTAVESSSLTTGLAAGPVPGDAVGDANIFTTFDGAWFSALKATNTNGVNGIVEAYARTSTGGLALYEGEDFWATDGPTDHLRQVFDDMINEDWSPDNLPSTTPAAGLQVQTKPLAANGPLQFDRYGSAENGDVTFAGSVTPAGRPASWWFDYGTVGQPGSTAQPETCLLILFFCRPGPQPFVANPMESSTTNIDPYHLYWYQAVAADGGSPVYGTKEYFIPGNKSNPDGFTPEGKYQLTIDCETPCPVFLSGNPDTEQSGSATGELKIDPGWNSDDHFGRSGHLPTITLGPMPAQE